MGLLGALVLATVSGCLDEDAAAGPTGIVGGPEGTTLKPGTGRVYGLVTDPDENPIPGVTVTVEIYPEWKATTSHEGKFVLMNLPPFNYTLAYSHPYSKTRLAKATVVADQITIVEVRLNPWGGEGTVPPTEAG